MPSLTPYLHYLIALALTLGLPPATAQNVQLPSMGAAGESTLSLYEESRLGQQIMFRVRAQGGLLNDPLVTDYLQQLGQRLLSHSERAGDDFTFFATPERGINAFALPGGYIGVNVGLIMATRTESELAGVLAHEIVHVTQRHIARRMEATRGLNIATTAAVLAAILASGGNAEVAEAALSTGMAASVENAIRYTHQNELEADRLGIRLLAGAGFDPSGMASFFQELQERSRFYETAYDQFLRTHPLTSTRISEAINRARDYHGPNPANSETYHVARARARFLTADDQQTLRTYFEEQAARGNGQSRRAASYGLALSLLASGQAAAAAERLQALVTEAETIPAYRLALAEAQSALGQNEIAQQTLSRAHTLFPDNVAVIVAYAQSLLREGQAAAAWPLLQSLPVAANTDPAQLRLMARAAQALGHDAQAHVYLAEHHVLSGHLLQAMEQLQIALDSDGLAPSDRERVKRRLDTLERLRKDMG